MIIPPLHCIIAPSHQFSAEGFGDSMRGIGADSAQCSHLRAVIPPPEADGGCVWTCRDIFRVFDSLNYIDNLRFGIDAVRFLRLFFNEY